MEIAAPMKIYQRYHSFSHIFCIFILSSFLVAAPVFAKDKKAAHQDAVAASYASEDYYHSGSEHRWGLGFSTSSYLIPGTTALTGWYDLTSSIALQPLATIEHTSPFTFGIGTLVKYTVARSGQAGFHLGGGITLGSVSLSSTVHDFALGLSALAGFHFPVPGASNIMVHLDGGPVFTVVGGDSDFRLQAVSPALGLSAIYLF